MRSTTQCTAAAALIIAGCAAFHLAHADTEALSPGKALSAADDLTQPVGVSPDGHFLVQPNGKPFFWLADTAWELFHRLDRAETENYLQDRSRKGFTVIQAVATGSIDVTGLQLTNREGHVPFVDTDPARPNPRYFAHIDWVVNRAAHYGLRIAILPTWGARFINGSVPVFDTVKAEAYGHWIGQRYRGRGIIWVLGGDTNPLSFNHLRYVQDTNSQWRGLGDRAVIDYRPVYDAMARGILAGDGGQPLITYHPTAGSPSGTALPRMSLYFGDRDWFHVSLLQSSHQNIGSADRDGGNYVSGRLNRQFVWNAPYSYVPVTAEYRAIPSRPVIDGEPRYEDHPMYTSAHVFTDPNYKATHYWRSHDVRTALYQALLAGAAGHTYGHFSIWDFYDPARRTGQHATAVYEKSLRKYPRLAWQEALNAPGAGQMQHAKYLLLSRPYFSRIPDQSLIIGDAGEGERHMGATRDAAGTYAMIYLPQGQPVTVDLSKLNGAYAVAWWFDPRQGTAKNVHGRFSTREKRSFVPPSRGADQDWVLVLDSEGIEFGPPGVQR